MNLGGASQSQRSFKYQESPLMMKKLLHQDPICLLKGNELKVILINLSLEMHEMKLKQEVLLRMNVYTTSSFFKNSQRKLRKHFKMLIGF